MNQAGLFDEENLRSLVRSNSMRTSVDAARHIKPKASALQLRVLEAFRNHGRMTAGECEALPEFVDLRASTVRKRISELKEAGKLVADGRREGMTIWALS